jgi:hypothetical protein
MWTDLCGSWAGPGLCVGLPRWAAAGLLRPGEPVSPSSFILVLLFSVFHFVNLNTVLNSIKFCKFDGLNSSNIHSRHLKIVVVY